MWPRLFDLLFLPVLFRICTALFDFIKPLYIFQTGSLLSLFVLFPFSFQSSVARSTLFFLSSFLLFYSFGVSLCLPLCCVLLPVWLFASVSPFSFFVFCTFISRRFLCVFSASLCLHFFFRSFTHFYFRLKLQAPSHVKPYSLVGGYQHFGRTCNLRLLHALKILVAVYFWTLAMYPSIRRHIP